MQGNNQSNTIYDNSLLSGHLIILIIFFVFFWKKLKILKQSRRYLFCPVKIQHINCGAFSILLLLYETTQSISCYTIISSPQRISNHFGVVYKWRHADLDNLPAFYYQGLSTIVTKSWSPSVNHGKPIIRIMYKIGSYNAK